MRKALPISFFLNLLLLAWLFVSLTLKRSDTPAMTILSKPITDVEHSETPSRSTEKTFHWSEIESEDYVKYLTNLRRIGCPEQTISDIITADVHNLYSQRRIALEKSTHGNESAAGKDTKVRALRDEEAWVLASLLGDKQTGESVAATVPARVQRGKEQPILMPLVFQDVNLARLGLNTEQVQAVSELRQKFLDQIGGAGQDVNEPAYREKWVKSQPEIDSELRGTIGVTAFQNYQIEAVDASPAAAFSEQPR